MLYKPEAFEQLTEEPWDVARVLDRIRAIVDGTEAAHDSGTLWPAQEWDSFRANLPLATLYAGASGVVWALDRLGSEMDLAAPAMRAVEKWRENPDSTDPKAQRGLYFGESGILFVAWKMTRDAALADDLYARVQENTDHESNELMHGSPGTMLIAKAMLDATGEERWADVWRESAEILWERRDENRLWPYPPYGPGFGAAHGAPTNASVLLQGDGLLDPERREAVARDTAAALARFAVIEDGRANWPLALGEDLEADDGQIRLQWCHGAAGVVASAAAFLDEGLLLAGAELCWQAGPPNLDKGYGLCHGTAGTGYAYLKTFERTQDDRWLEQARRFAVHALEQVERLPPRYSLMTGSVGAALFAADCLEARPTVPIVDVL